MGNFVSGLVFEQCLVCLGIFTLDELFIDTVQFDDEDEWSFIITACVYCAES